MRLGRSECKTYTNETIDSPAFRCSLFHPPKSFKILSNQSLRKLDLCMRQARSLTGAMAEVQVWRSQEHLLERRTKNAMNRRSS